MEAANQPTPEPRADAAEPVSPTAERPPAGAACCQCAYELAGLAPGGVCPECGLDISASWPATDLRQCHRVYVEHLAEEFRMLHWAALAGWVVLAATLAAAVGGALAEMADGLWMVAMGAGMVAMGAVVVLPLMVWYARRSLRAHPSTRMTPGASERRRLRRALLLGQVGLLAVLLWMALGFFGGGDGLRAPLLASTTVATVGLAWASFEAVRYANHTLDRAGKSATSGAIHAAWGFALAVLALALAASLAFTLDDSWRIAAITGGQLAPATVVALRCGRVVAVAEAIVARRA